MQKEDVQKLNIVESTTILAISTTLFFTLAFSYKAGYYSYFNVPLFYHSFDVRNNVDSMIWLAIYFILIFASFIIVHNLNRFINYIDNKATPLKKKVKIKNLGVISLSISIPVLVYLLYYNVFTFIIGLLIILAIGLCFLTYIYLMKSKGKYLAYSFLVLLIGLCVMILVYTIGYSNASVQKSFYTKNYDEKTYIILGIKDERYISVEYDTDLNEIKRQIRYSSVDNDDIKYISVNEPPGLYK